eukprot:scaffold14736_cov84-Skeletonema_dohrnii-CCMP3373.AAC.2
MSGVTVTTALGLGVAYRMILESTELRYWMPFIRSCPPHLDQVILVCSGHCIVPIRLRCLETSQILLSLS